MREMVVAEYVTVDGIMEETAWTGPYFNEEAARAQLDLLRASEALLLERVTYQGFAAVWPSMTDEAGFADGMNGLPPSWFRRLWKGPSGTTRR